MTPTFRRVTLTVLFLASMSLGACAVTTPAKIVAGATAGAVKGAVGAIF